VVLSRHGLRVCRLGRYNSEWERRGEMKMHKKFLDFEYEEVLDVKTRELIRVACAVAVGCPA
jgi:alkylhydroperoxidase/carboxymuconolactone decarboxylase family protein YurZ